MKKKLLSLLVLLYFVSTPVVDAARKVVGDPVESEMYFKGDNNYTAGSSTKITMEGGYEAFCIDPGQATATANATCDHETVDGALGAGYTAIMSSDADDDTKGLALRIYATASGDSSFQDSSSKKAVNTRCGYVRAAKLAADQAGTQVVDSIKDDTSYAGTNCVENFSLYNNEGSVTNAAINLASEGLKTQKNAEANNGGGASGSKAPSCKASAKQGKVTISCSNVPEGSTLTVSGAISGGGEVPAGSFTQEFTADCEGSTDSTYSAELSYKQESGKCSEAVHYSCSGLGKDAQNYMGCNQEGDGAGETKLPIATDAPVNCGKPEEPEDDECQEEPGIVDKTPGGMPGDANGLCDDDGNTVIAVTEGYEYTSSDESVDACVIDGEDITGESLEATGPIMGDKVNEYCNVYCTEDYEFLSPGPLSSMDKDGDEYLVTSGSYFNFDPDEATDKTSIYCYGENYIDKLMENIVKKAQNYANTLAETNITCSSKEIENEDGTTEIKEYKTTETKGYEARRKGDKLEVEIVENHDPGIPEEVPLGTCVPETIKNDASTIQKAKEDYIKYSNDQVKLFDEECNKWDFKNLASKIGVDGNCHPTVVFTYTDGEWIKLPNGVDNITPIELELVSVKPEKNGTTQTYESNTGKYQENKTDDKATISLGVDSQKTQEFTAADYTSNEEVFINTYKLNSIGICNNYNSGQSSYGISKDDCEKIEGATYVEGWPVDYETPQGQYSYQFIVSGYGHSFDGGKCTPGRLDDVASYLGMDETDLICPYKVNGCDECDWYCDPQGNCKGNPDCDDKCIWECREVGCVFDISNGLAIDFAPISLMNPFVAANVKYLNDIHNSALAYNANNTNDYNNSEENIKDTTIAVGTPNKEGLAANWRTTKGQAALDAIESLGEEAYTDANLEYRITLNPLAIRAIRDYNEKAQADGGYLNKTLSCKNETEDYVICSSTYLEQLEGMGGVTVDNRLNQKSAAERISPSIKDRKSGEGPAFR